MSPPALEEMYTAAIVDEALEESAEEMKQRMAKESERLHLVWEMKFNPPDTSKVSFPPLLRTKTSKVDVSKAAKPVSQKKRMVDPCTEMGIIYKMQRIQKPKLSKAAKNCLKRQRHRRNVAIRKRAEQRLRETEDRMKDAKGNEEDDLDLDTDYFVVEQ
jgi:methionyl-tRNA formyltransferase